MDEELEAETKEECAHKYGRVLKCTVREDVRAPDDEAVRIFVEFADVESAKKGVHPTHPSPHGTHARGARSARGAQRALLRRAAGQGVVLGRGPVRAGAAELSRRRGGRATNAVHIR